MAIHNIQLDFGGTGILEFDGQRYGVKAMSIRHNPDSYPLFEGYLIPEAFAQSNAFARRVGRNPEIKKVIFSDPATVVVWADGTKTVVKCQSGDTYSKETGLALCIAKKYLGNKGNFNEVFKKWIPEEISAEEISVNQMRCRLTEWCTGRSCGHFSNGDKCPLLDHPYSCNFPEDHFRPMSDNQIRDAYKVVFARK